MPRTLETWPIKNGVKVGYLNINSARNKTDDIAYILHNNGQNFHLLGIAESRLDDSIPDSDIMMPNYNVIRLDSRYPKETGLLLYCINSVNYKRIQHLENHNVESIWVEIHLKHHKPILVGFIYRNPAETIEWYDHFNSMMDAVTLESKEVILLGDFNINLDASATRWCHHYSSYDLEQLIDRPTRITENTATLIDHIYADTKGNIIETCAVQTGCSDHAAICLTWNKKGVKIPKPGHKEIYYRCFTKFCEKDFIADLVNSNLKYVYQIRDPNDAVDFWISTFISIYDKHAPFVKKRVKHSMKPPWISKEIDDERHKRDNLLSSNDKEKIKKQTNKLNSMKCKAKTKYFQDLICSTQNPKSVWKAINTLTNKDVKVQTQISEVSPEDINFHFPNVTNSVI